MIEVLYRILLRLCADLGEGTGKCKSRFPAGMTTNAHATAINGMQWQGRREEQASTPKKRFGPSDFPGMIISALGRISGVFRSTVREAGQQYMDRLDSKARANVSRIKDLLNESIEGATVETTKLPDYQQKFKIDANGKRVFLIVSLEYLEDRDEQQIRRAFERYILPTLLTSDPGERFLLSGQGLNRIQSDLVAS